MLPALAEVDDLARGIPDGIDPEDEDRAQWVLEVVSGWVRIIARKDWIPPVVPPNDVIIVLLLAAKREFLNPRYVTQEAEGPTSATYAANSVPDGVFTPAEKAILERQFNKRGGMYMRTHRRDDVRLTIGYLQTIPAGGRLFGIVNPLDPDWDTAIHI
jgi:hypothetical protein